MTDAQALDQIAEVLNTCAWDFEAVEAVAAALRATGRDVATVDVAGELAQIKIILDAIRKARI